MSSALWGNPEQVHPGLVKKRQLQTQFAVDPQAIAYGGCFSTRLCSVKEALIKSELPWAITVNYLKTHVLA
jgi:hypothetical protein